MSDNNYDKDYGEYFKYLEDSLNNKREYSVKNTVYVPKKTVKHKKPYLFKVFKVNIFKIALFLLALSVLTVGMIFLFKGCKEDSSNINANNESAVISEKKEKTVKDKDNTPRFEFPVFSDMTEDVPNDITSECVLFINNDTNCAVASRNAEVKAFPASTTKLMTLLVAVENLKDFDATYTMSYRITDPLYKQEATVAGFLSGETVNMTDLLYGTVLPSGADAAIALAETVSGSEQEFVKLMNNKCRELGLKNTNFVNCTGLFDSNHYTTALDMSVIMKAVLDNAICKEIVSTYKFTTTKTPQHPDGIVLENTLFKYMYGTEPKGAEILGGKTGFTNESGYCICTFGQNESNTQFICVTLKGKTRWPAVFDQINLYTYFAK